MICPRCTKAMVPIKSGFRCEPCREIVISFAVASGINLPRKFAAFSK